MALTDREIRCTKPGSKAARLWDSHGLYLEVSPAGNRLWRYKYRFEGREKRLAFGSYPAISLRAAREARDNARRQLVSGVDPGESTKASKLTKPIDTFETIARDWHDLQKNTWSAIHAGTTLARLEGNVFPWIGSRRIREISAPDLLAILRRIETRGAIETAHRVRSICGQVFRFAIASGHCDRDPTVDLRGALKPVDGGHFAAPIEPAALRPILLAFDGYAGTQVVRTALLLAPLLFVRPGELRSMRWADIDLSASEWRFVASKTHSQHIVPLSKQAKTLLRDLRPLTGLGTYVFPSMHGSERCISNNTLTAALHRLNIDTKTELTTHGWRAVARTMLEERLRFRPEIVEMQLAHQVRDPLGRAYNRTTHLEERRRMMQVWADFLDGMRTEKGATGAVAS